MRLKKISPQETFEGDGVVVSRLFPTNNRMNFDPFVLWDHFDIAPGHGFPEHPHRGFEAITYMLSGKMHHKDNLGNDAWVGAGGAQVFCAGKGIQHSEMPGDKSNSVGIQLWINLAKKDKGIEPNYQQILAERLPTRDFEGGHCIDIVGNSSPIALHTEITYQHIQMDENAQYCTNIKPKHNVIIYLLRGVIELDGQTLRAKQAFLIKQFKAEDLVIHAKQACSFMICAGLPHNEIIHQHGPFVD